MKLPDQTPQSYEARRQYGGFMQRKVQTILPDGSTATLTSGIFGGSGVITTSENSYQIGQSSMSDGGHKIVEYKICGGFMKLPKANLYDVEQNRRYTFGQRRCWSSTLVLHENEIQVAEFRSKVFQSRYQVLANKETPTHIVLNCIWIAMIRMAFAA